MYQKRHWGVILSATCAGIINGLFGAGGGMILVPLLEHFTSIDDASLFPSSIGIILPVCLVSLSVSAIHTPLPWEQAIPYLIGGTIGGMLAGKFGRNIPALWLHRGFGLLIIWGGIRYLC